MPAQRLNQLAAERARAGELPTVRHQRHQHLAARMPHAHHDMAQKAAVRILAVGLDAEAGHEGTDGQDNLLGLLVLHEAPIGRHDAVRVGGVHAAEYLMARPPLRAAVARLAGTVAARALALLGPATRRGTRQLLARRIRRDHLVAVAERVVHAQDRPQLGAFEAAEQLGHARILARELGRIGLVRVLAGAARPGMGADGRPCAGARGAVPRAVGTVGGVRVLQPFRHFRTRLSSSRKATL